ncbi:uncharacterized protein C8Q71DRAFT_359250 [Rhodofomes roseus]|uniref:F-box domain-containing protein n=1 Tax=Rhodofomes roseus TaxID=34475 RepID=A0ABQ8K1P2_9APHY|nr:uncharacterized protein C8Q71DRAFT_359250 [Rhodofomes roseus]KAH9830587.1 hypothetical protein C8Q71DRAFT_359250 [Rhodofomes roseus]
MTLGPETSHPLQDTGDDTVISIPRLPAEASPRHEELWKEMLVHSEAIRGLKSRWNTLATISTLPDEILAEIFFQLNLLYRNDELEWRTIHRYEWINVCQVCSHWRTVALSSSRLWSDITVTRSMSWMREVLARSQQAPLRVQFAMVNLADGMDQAARLFLEELARVEEAVIGVTTDAFEVLNGLDRPAPLLRFLTVKAVYYRAPRPPGTPPIYPALQVLTRPFVGRLERLNLLGCPFPWNTPLSFTSLSHLTLVGTGVDRPHMPDVTVTLTHLRLLKCLDLEDILPMLPKNVSSVPASQAVVRMAYLENLRLVGETIDCAYMLSHLTFPPSISLVLRCTSKRGLADLVMLIKDRLPQMQRPRTLLFDEDFSESHFHVRVSTNDGPPADGVPFPLVITFRSDPQTFAAESHTQCAIAFCLRLGVAHVRHLHVAGIIPPMYDEDQTKEWLQLFVHLNSLTVLSMSGLAAYRLPDMLKARAWDDSNRLSLPNLRRAEVERVSFGVAETFQRGQPGDFTEQLVQSLDIRAREIATFGTLVIRRSKCVDMPDIRTLEKAVENVEWDGIVDTSPSPEDFELNYY